MQLINSLSSILLDLSVANCENMRWNDGNALLNLLLCRGLRCDGVLVTSKSTKREGSDCSDSIFSSEVVGSTRFCDFGDWELESSFKSTVCSSRSVFACYLASAYVSVMGNSASMSSSFGLSPVAVASDSPVEASSCCNTNSS